MNLNQSEGKSIWIIGLGRNLTKSIKQDTLDSDLIIQWIKLSGLRTTGAWWQSQYISTCLHSSIWIFIQNYNSNFLELNKRFVRVISLKLIVRSS